VRLVPALASLTLTASLAACGGSAPASQSSSTAAVRLAPSGFTLQPDISDSRCNGGHGVRLPARLGSDPVIASATMIDGSTLIAVSSGYPTKRFATLHSVTFQCAPNSQFGAGGVATIGVSSNLEPAHAVAGNVLPDGLWVNAVAARQGGGAIVAGTYDGEWIVGEVTPLGKLDPTFGNGGWRMLPFRGEVTAVVQDPSGRIVIGGDNGGGGCCTLNWAAALSTHGELEDTFGKRGRQELPTGEDSGVDSLALEPNGDILATTTYGNMGCWGLAPAMLNPSGRPVPLFGKRVGRFWERLGFGAFAGDVYVNGDGFSLVGTGQKPCDDGLSTSVAPATGLITRFRTDGRLVGQTSRFPSRLYGVVQAFQVGDDALVLESLYADPIQVTVTARRPDGKVDPQFGIRGRAVIHTPWRGRNAALDTMVSITRASSRTIDVIATLSGQNQLELVRLVL
jgi:hypothetical protein